MKSTATIHETHPRIVKRLRLAEGHLHKVIGMFADGRSCVDLAQQLYAVERAIAQAAIEDAGRRGAERIVLGERSRLQIAPAQRSKPPGLLAHCDARGGDKPRRVWNVVARRIADLGLRIAGKRLGGVRLIEIVTD